MPYAKLTSLLLPIICAFLTPLSAADPDQTDSEAIDFARDIRPLLSDRCFTCHGPDAGQREADLRLDTFADATEYAIVPGDAEGSEVIERIYSTDPELVMPPPEAKLELSAAEKKLLADWVQSGAQYDEHWSFKSISKPALPVESPTGAIDFLIQQKLSAAGQARNEEADKYALLRRATLDLIGLPPTLEQVEDFINDESPDAYERVLDRLLASEQYGEHMAVDWLDVARYADTYGYQNDRYRPMWPWRDWVIKAFNENLSYSDFITWQIAGDLLPNASRDQILATAFNRNHRQTNEGGSVEEEFRAEYVADRVNTFGAAFLGLTLECCRCHDHKYDPVTQREYYQLAAFFNSIDESGLYSHFTEATPTPTLWLSEESQAQKIEELEASIAALKVNQQALLQKADGFAAWRGSLTDVRPSPNLAPSDAVTESQSLMERVRTSADEGLLAHFAFEQMEENRIENQADETSPAKASDNPRLVEGKNGQGLQLSGDNNVTFKPGGDFSRNQPFSISMWIKPNEDFERAVILHRSRAWTDSGSRGYELLIEEGRLSAALIHFWPGNAMRVVSSEKLAVDQWTHIGFTYDGSSKASGMRLYIDGDLAAAEVVRDKLTKHIDGADGFGGGDARDVAIGQRFRDIGFKDSAVDELRIYDREIAALEMKAVYIQDAFPANLREVLHNASDELLKEYFVISRPGWKEQSQELRKLRDERSRIADKIPEIMVMREDPNPRTTHILIRGAYDSPGDLVERGTPAKILPREFAAAPSRIDLANWLTDPAHPLTARVAVNRIWQQVFGRGLVGTPEDFGLQGSLPSHPKLLDWLAADFIESGWDVKRLLKSILLSETYRQSSDASPEKWAADPENRLLGRGPSGRLRAETIRDSALAASGLLVEKIGGAPVKPYQPAGLWKEKSGQTYKRDQGAGSHRRSLYTYWKRTSPPPSMMTLDASNREICVVQRQVTMTPLQILVLLNDPQFVEAAKSLASRALEDAPDDLNKQIRFVFESLVTRPASEKELAVLQKIYSQQLALLDGNDDRLNELLSVGDFEPSPKLDRKQLGALTLLAEGLMSFDETITKR